VRTIDGSIAHVDGFSSFANSPSQTEEREMFEEVSEGIFLSVQGGAASSAAKWGADTLTHSMAANLAL